MKRNKMIVIAMLILTTLFVADCSKKQKADYKGTDKFWVLGANNQKLIKFKFRVATRKAKIEFNDRRSILKAKKTNTGKIQYEVAHDVNDRKNIDKKKFKVRAKVIPFAKGFKVRDTSGKLIWKVRISPKSVKISRDDKNSNPRILRFVKDKQEGKIWFEKSKIGRAKWKDGKTVVIDGNGKRQYSIDGSRFSATPGILLMDGIPLEERLILISELYLRKL